MAGKLGFGLLSSARLKRRQLVAFALISAVVNGIVTAGIGAYLARTYAVYHERRQSITGIASLFYARRTRAGMVVSSLRRNAEIEEIRDRKRAYDEAYVDWNTNIRRNLFVIREVMGEKELANLEQVFEDTLVASLSEIDRCLTKAYDQRIAGQSPLATLETCRMPEVYQFALDCGATFTNELYKMSQLTFLPFGRLTAAARKEADRVRKGCIRPPPAKRPDSAKPAVHDPAQPPAAQDAVPQSTPAGAVPERPPSQVSPSGPEGASGSPAGADGPAKTPIGN